MAKVLTLRNIIALLALLFLVACESKRAESDELHTISSEDTYTDVMPVGVVADPEGGQTVFVVQKK